MWLNQFKNSHFYGKVRILEKWKRKNWICEIIKPNLWEKSNDFSGSYEWASLTGHDLQVEDTCALSDGVWCHALIQSRCAGADVPQCDRTLHLIWATQKNTVINLNDRNISTAHSINKLTMQERVLIRENINRGQSEH